jgi:cell division protease FtsH
MFFWRVSLINYRNFLIWVSIVCITFLLYSVLGRGYFEDPPEQIPFSEFLNSVEEGTVKKVNLDNQRILGVMQDGTMFQTYQPVGNSVTGILHENGVEIFVKAPKKRSFLSVLFPLLFPFILVFGGWMFLMSRINSGGGRGSAMGFGKIKARLLTENTKKITFDDVAGIEEAKDELQEIVEFLKDSQKYSRLGGKIPKGALLIGPPGTGKTLLARAIAGEAGVPFLSISGSDFVEMFVGVGASRVRDMFEQAKKNAPCIVFVDEIDAVGRHRGAGYGGGNDEREQTLNQLLVEMDGFEANEGVILIAATNRADVLDPALMRPGRFDRQINVPNPDMSGRHNILKVHMRNVVESPDINLRVIARGTPGFSGADLANLVNEAALRAARLGKECVTMEDFEFAKDKVMMGSERRSLVMSEKEKELTAYHEAGHVLVSVSIEGTDPIHKATVIPRGQALGLVLSLPERDHLSQTRLQMTSQIAMAMGGRVAEEVIFGADYTTNGAASDIQHVTRIAKAMVMRYGMSEKLGTIDYAGQEESFWAQNTNKHSHETLESIDNEIRRLVEDGFAKANEVIHARLDDLHKLASALIEYETLSGEEITKILQGEKIQRMNEEEEADNNNEEEKKIHDSIKVPKSKRTQKDSE